MQFWDFNDVYLEDLYKGDLDTERHFADYFTEFIHMKLGSRIESKEVIDDLKQETFVRVFALVRKKGIHKASALGALVNSVCNHVLLEYYHFRLRADNKEGLETIDPPSKAKDAFHEALSRETEEVVRQVLNELEDRERRLLKRVFLEERDKDEICAEFGIGKNYLRVLLHRAKSSFRAKYIRRLSLSKLKQDVAA